MAIIKCPECSHDVSDKAKTCPYCGFAVADNRPNGDIRIKLASIYNHTRKVIILSPKGVLWKGRTGQIAEFHLDKPTDVCIKYSILPGIYSLKCDAYIDPSKGRSYQIQPLFGVLKNRICLNRVDVIDSD